MMDIGARISKKIEKAIIAKLKELNAYVDEELPDYIMIMVANRKTEHQMTNALSLFLSDNTSTFTGWLHDLLARLRQIDNKQKIDETAISIEPETDDVLDEELLQRPNMSSSHDSLSLPPNKQHNIYQKQTLCSVMKSAPSVPPARMTLDTYCESGKVKTRTRENDVTPSKTPTWMKKNEGKSLGRKRRYECLTKDDKKSGFPNCGSLKIDELNYKVMESRVHEWDRGKDKSRNDLFQQASRKAAIGWTFLDDDTARDRQGPVASVVKPVLQDVQFVSDNESDGEWKASTLPSRVAYPERKIRLPLAKQASKVLLMRAVSEAEKSVKLIPTHCGKMEIASLPCTAEEKQMSKSSSERREELDENAVRKGSKWKKTNWCKKNKLQRKNIIARQDVSVSDKNKRRNFDSIGGHSFNKDKSPVKSDYRRVTVCSRESVPSFQRPTEGKTDDTFGEFCRFQAEAASQANQQIPETVLNTPPQVHDPQFIVTLDGVASAHGSAKEVCSRGRLETEELLVQQKSEQRESQKIRLKEQDFAEMRREENLSSVHPERSDHPQINVNIACGIEEGVRSIYVANVNFSTTEKQLSDYFSICGKVLRVTIPKDSFTGHPRGYAFLEFENERSICSALALDNSTLNHRVIRVALKRGMSVALNFPKLSRFSPQEQFRGQSAPFLSPFSSGAYLRRFNAAASYYSVNRRWVNPMLSAKK